ncbi:MAG: 50S ribosomal protein L9 [Patescibacteria group bacterium]
MKVILQKEIKNLGKEGDLKQVSDGYARNYLIPRGLAEPATPSKINIVRGKQKKASEKEKRAQKRFKETADKLKIKILEFKKKANEAGHLFAGLHAAEIIAKIEAETGVKLKDGSLELAEPLKKIGPAVIRVKLSPQNQIDLPINILKE